MVANTSSKGTNVVPFKLRKDATTVETVGLQDKRAIGADNVEMVTLRPEAKSGAEHSGKITKIGDLYPISPAFGKALDILNKHEEVLRELRDNGKGNVLDKDAAVDLLKAALPSLMVTPNVGEGWKALLSGLYHALRNQAGQPLNDTQFDVIYVIVRALAAKPQLTIDNSLSLFDDLETAELNPEPIFAPALSELLTGQPDA